MHEGGHDEGQQGAARGAHQRHQLTKVGDPDHDDAGEQDHEQPQHLGLGARGGDGHLLLEDGEHREEHDGVGEEEADTETAFDQDGKVESSIGGEVEGDDVPSLRAVAEVGKAD